MSNGQKTLESMSQAVWYNQWTLEQFSKYLKGDILEIGCGIGNFTSTLQKYGTVWAIDIEKEYVEKTKKKTGSKTVGIGDIEKNKFFFKSQKFDAITSLNVFEHIKDDGAAIKNSVNLLKKNGHLILLVPAFQFLYGDIDRAIDHYRRYEKKKLLEILKSHQLEIVNSRIINFLGAIGWFLSGKVLHNKTVQSEKMKLFNAVAPIVLPIEKFIPPPIGTSILIIAKKK